MSMFPKTLAIDYGESKVGIALSYDTLADPVMTLKNNALLIPALRSLCAEHAVEQLLVGISEHISEERSRAFAAKLQAELALPLFFADETLSTKTAQELLRQTKGKAYRGQDDHIAAAVFLQEWIDTRG